MVTANRFWSQLLVAFFTINLNVLGSLSIMFSYRLWIGAALFLGFHSFGLCIYNGTMNVLVAPVNVISPVTAEMSDFCCLESHVGGAGRSLPHQCILLALPTTRSDSRAKLHIGSMKAIPTVNRQEGDVSAYILNVITQDGQL